MLKYGLLLALALLWLTIPADAIIYHSSLLVHSQSGKRVLLLDDAHAQWIERFGIDADKSRHDELYAEQKKELDLFGMQLLSSEKDGGGVVLTETSDNAYGCMVEQELGAVPIKNNKEILEILPRMFLHSLIASGESFDAKVQLLKNAAAAFRGQRDVSLRDVPDAIGFRFDNGLIWIIGDRRRTSLDLYLSFTVYEKWQQIIDAFNEHQSLLWKIKNYFGCCGTRNAIQDEVVPGTDVVPTIEYVIEYIDALHTEFEKYGIVEPYYVRLSQFLKQELEAGHIVGTDHIARLYAYLARNNRQGSLNGFNADMLAFVSLKCDVEFRDYAQAFNDDPMRKYMVVIAGGVHNLDMQTVLTDQGYILDTELGHARNPDSEVDISVLLDGAAKKPLQLLHRLFDF